MKITKNPNSKPESKTQKKKMEYLKKHPTKFVECEKCGDRHTTLHNVCGKYYCKKHIPE